MTLRLSQDVTEQITNAAKEIGISTQELIRRAIGTELFLIEEKKVGSRFFVESKNEKVKEIILR
ncbi:MAG: CopG family transcriptional regulator [Methylococcaceae bacterium]